MNDGAPRLGELGGREGSEGPAVSRLMRWLLSRVVDADRLPEVLGDLHEAACRRPDGLRRGLWLRYQAMVLWFLLSRERRREARAIRKAERTSRERDMPLTSGNGGPWLDPESWSRDIRYALRRLVGTPGFTLVAVLSLALGIGANTAIFSVVNTMLIRDLPVRAPEDLVEIYTSKEGESPFGTTSYPDFESARDQTDVFEGVVAYAAFFGRVENNDQTGMVMGEIVSHDLFSVLGIQPVLGRTFLPEEGERGGGANPVVILGHGYWKQNYGADPGVIGRTVRLNHQHYTIVGVLPEEVQSIMATGIAMDLFAPMSMFNELSPRMDGRDQLAIRGLRNFFVKGRLREGVNAEQADAALKTVSAHLQDAFPESNEGRGLTVLRTLDVALHPLVDQALIPVAALLMGVVGLVLFIACTNLASFLLARAADRKKEIAVRLALGASRGILIRQLLVEATLLAMTGGAAGLVIAHWTIRAITNFQPPIPVPINLSLGLDRNVLLYTGVISLAAGLLFGLAPALQATKPDVAPTLKDEGGAGTTRQRRLSLRNVLVVTQVAVSLLLLVGAGLFVRSLRAAQDIDLGFTIREGALVWVDFTTGGIAQEQWRPLYQDLRDRASLLPGVESVALVEMMPLGVGFRTLDVEIPGYEPPPGEDGAEMASNTVDAAYREVMGITMLSGRWFDAADRAESPLVVVVSEAAARAYWPGEDPLGRGLGLFDERSFQVIGVASDTKVLTLGEDPRPYLYFNLEQQPVSLVHVVARAAGTTPDLVAGLRQSVRDVSADLMIMDSKTLEQHLAIMLFPPRMAAMLLGVFGALALVLAAIGLYGVVSYAVSRRTREMGIRISLGAEPNRVLWMVLRGGMGPVVVGSAIGLTVAFGVARLIGQFLYGIGTNDPVTFIGVPALLGFVALLAALVPAWRASRVDPVEAIRYE